MGAIEPLPAAPAPKREFRATWVASVYNLCWPSKPGLSAAAQQAELRQILDQAARSGLNAVLLQVRPECDALYSSKMEPWSAWLTGSQGESPGYDPLDYAVKEAHRRGLELHAWFNPFRAQTSTSRPVASSHVSRRHPEWTRKFGASAWLDPGEPAVRAYVVGVIMDVVRRYDIDGVHLDDYFYPYPAKGAPSQFPDASTFAKYGSGDRGDWRRDNINRFVQDLYRSVKSAKPSVKVGISPFGIWRPGIPEGTTAGIDAYGQLFGDSRKWLAEGWVDYLMPQLYWTIESSGQSFQKLIVWWNAQNRSGRHVWPGIATERVGKDRAAAEIRNQISMVREVVGASPGHSHWDSAAFLRNKGGVRTLLEETVYADRALVPASNWLGTEPPALPEVAAEWGADQAKLSFKPQQDARFFAIQYAVETGHGEEWKLEVVDAASSEAVVPHTQQLRVAAQGRTGQLSEWVTFTKDIETTVTIAKRD